MGKIIHSRKLREFFSSTPVFTARDIKIAVGGGYSRLLLHNLTGSGEIKRLVRGYYTVLDDPIVSVFCFRPAYLGLYTALSMHNLWEQETNINIITSRNVRTGMRNVLESNVNIYKMDNDWMFGFDMLRYGDIYLPVSSVEKTLLDFFYFGKDMDRAMLKTIKSHIDMDKLSAYSSRLDRSTKEKVEKFLRTRF